MYGKVLGMQNVNSKRFEDTVEPRYNEVLGTMNITLLYPVIISG